MAKNHTSNNNHWQVQTNNHQQLQLDKYCCKEWYITSVFWDTRQNWSSLSTKKGLQQNWCCSTCTCSHGKNQLSYLYCTCIYINCTPSEKYSCTCMLAMTGFVVTMCSIKLLPWRYNSLQHHLRHNILLTLSMMVCSLDALSRFFLRLLRRLWKPAMRLLIFMASSLTVALTKGSSSKSEALFSSWSVRATTCCKKWSQNLTRIHSLSFFVATCTFAEFSNSCSSPTNAWTTSKESPISVWVSKNSSAYCSNHSMSYECVCKQAHDMTAAKR